MIPAAWWRASSASFRQCWLVVKIPLIDDAFHVKIMVPAPDKPQSSGPGTPARLGPFRGIVTTALSGDEQLFDRHACPPHPHRWLRRPLHPFARSQAATGPGWVHEIKHDGYRLIVPRRDGPTVRLFTRRGHDWTERYAALDDGPGWRETAGVNARLKLPETSGWCHLLFFSSGWENTASIEGAWPKPRMAAICEDGWRC
jgi:hypothetical protein